MMAWNAWSSSFWAPAAERKRPSQQSEFAELKTLLPMKKHSPEIAFQSNLRTICYSVRVSACFGILHNYDKDLCVTVFECANRLRVYEKVATIIENRIIISKRIIGNYPKTLFKFNQNLLLCFFGFNSFLKLHYIFVRCPACLFIFIILLYLFIKQMRIP